ncbi:MAG: hypothetical protein AMXMBFR56_72750 [Polyangiaceae bacterium]
MAAENWSAGVGRGEVGSDDVKYYEPEPRERKVQLNLRVEESLRRGLDSLVQLWKVYAKARGDDPADVDLTFVIRRLLLVGIQGAFGEVLAEAKLDAMPVSDAEWARFEKSLEKMVRDRG